jgi:hypothetical protein
VDEWSCIGNESIEQVHIRQFAYYVEVIKSKKYVRNRDKLTQDSDFGIRFIPPAKAILARSLVEVSLLAGTLCSKNLDAMVFYRAKMWYYRLGLFKIMPLHQVQH